MQYFNKMFFFIELPQQKLMDCADLTDKGRKVFGTFQKVEFTTTKPLTEKDVFKLGSIFSDQEAVNKIELIILNNELIYDRGKYELLSDGENCISKSTVLKNLGGNNAND